MLHGSSFTLMYTCFLKTNIIVLDSHFLKVGVHVCRPNGNKHKRPVGKEYKSVDLWRSVCIATTFEMLLSCLNGHHSLEPGFWTHSAAWRNRWLLSIDTGGRVLCSCGLWSALGEIIQVMRVSAISQVITTGNSGYYCIFLLKRGYLYYYWQTINPDQQWARWSAPIFLVVHNEQRYFTRT
jgi:hypothetical protein